MCMEIQPASFTQVLRARDGRMVVVDDDVLGVARQLREIDTSLRLRYSEAGNYWVVYQEIEENGAKRMHLVLTSRELTPAIVKRVQQIAHPSYNAADEADRLDREARKERERKLSEALGDAGERLHHAFGKMYGFKHRAFIPDGGGER